MGGTAFLAITSMMQGERARKDTKKESERLQAEQDENMATEQREKFSAKKREYDNTRSITRRGQNRGRASTILNKTDTLG